MGKDKSDTWSAVAMKAYEDTLHPAAQELGKTVALPFRWFNALLADCYKYVMNAEENMKETEALLAQKLANFKPEQIQSPDPYVAVPVLQALSYAKGEQVLREMFANLLVASMVKDKKQSVHPAYVELIKQMSSDEARIMRYFAKVDRCEPAITLRVILPDGKGEIDCISWLTLLYKKVDCLQCRDPKNVSVALNNLERLGLLVKGYGRHLSADVLYQPLEQDEYVMSVKQNARIEEGAQWKFDKSYVELTPFGTSFAGVCIS